MKLMMGCYLHCKRRTASKRTLRGLNDKTGNDILKGGAGVDVYQANNSFGTDIITDSDGQGIVIINNIALNNASYQFQDIYKNDATGYTVTKLNAGATLVISKPSDTDTPNRIIIQEFSPTKDLSISLTGQAEPAPATTLSGDFKKQINDNGTTDTGDDTYEITNATTSGNYVRDTSNGDGLQHANDLADTANDDEWRLVA